MTEIASRLEAAGVSKTSLLGKMLALVEASFREGYDSYETQCCAYNNVETAWLESNARAEVLTQLEVVE